MEKQKCLEDAVDSVRSFIILDLETTGLYQLRKITEISVVAAMREHILDFGNSTNKDPLPRVLSKLCLCVYPNRMISQGATDCSGLSNELLEHQSPFDEDLFNMLDSFIKRLPQPVCLVAHNGIKFDFPILKSELEKISKKLPDHVLCADSLLAVRELLQSKEVKEVYESEVTVITSTTSIKTCKDLPDGIPSNNLFGDIRPLNSDLVEDESHECVTRQIQISKNESLIEKHNEHLNDFYDDDLYAVVDAIESSPEFKNFKPLDETDNSAIVGQKQELRMRMHNLTSKVDNFCEEVASIQKKVFNSRESETISANNNSVGMIEPNFFQNTLEKSPKSKANNEITPVQSSKINQSLSDSNREKNDQPAGGSLLCNTMVEATESSSHLRNVKPSGETDDCIIILEQKQDPKMRLHNLTHKVDHFCEEVSSIQKNILKSHKFDTNTVNNNSANFIELNSLQNTLEKTPKSASNKISPKAHQKASINETTPVQDQNTSVSSDGTCSENNCQTAGGSSKGKRGNATALSRARKRLNFSPSKCDKPKSFKLGDVYRFLLKREPENCHRAENDTLILLECILAMGEQFVQWVDIHAIQFNSVETKRKL